MKRNDFALIFVVVFALLCTTSFAASAFPCHDNKNGMGKGVTCTVVKLPGNLCSACPLRPPNALGQFKKCDDTYDSSAPACLSAMKKYVADNPCDPIRADAVAKFEQNQNDNGARQIVDYFLYTVCEQCCDCVPMGANKDFYSQYASVHSSSNPTLLNPARGNCPAHAYYDVCKILPKVKAFTTGGVGDYESWPPACGLLSSWFASPASKDWQDEPNSNIKPDLRNFLNNMMGAAQCSSKNVWDKCFDLESKQKHLGVPESAPDLPQVPDDPVDEEPETGEEDPAAPPAADPAPAPAPSTSDAAQESENETSIEPEQVRDCFPGDAKVELADGRRITMEMLRIGDLVRVDEHRFEPVYMFSHADKSTKRVQVSIELEDGNVVQMTYGHMLQVNGRMEYARNVVPGDVVLTKSGVGMVKRSVNVLKSGLYNPHTASGTIVVNNVICSTFTDAINDAAANALLAPLRMLFRTGFENVIDMGTKAIL